MDIETLPYGLDFSAPVVILVVVIFLIFFLFLFFTIYLRQRVQPRATVDAGLNPIEIQRFPVIVYSAGEDMKAGMELTECAVCLSEFRDSETLRLMPTCDHVFHRNCIDVWLASQATCPVCRSNLTADRHEKPTGAMIEGDRSEDGSDQTAGTGNGSVRSERRVERRFPRWHSTGYSPVQLDSRLIKRSASYDVVLCISEAN